MKAEYTILCHILAFLLGSLFGCFVLGWDSKESVEYFALVSIGYLIAISEFKPYKL